MPTLICGSLAFDTITTFDGRFAEHILPDKVHILNISFLVPTMRREFGGCAGNIAYSLALLGGEPLILGALGADGQSYLDRLDALHIARTYVGQLADSFTAQAHIITDRDNNQITSFHPGAMGRAHELPVPLDAGVDLAIIAPDGRSAMIDHAAQLAAAGIPFIFDPGQGMPLFDGADLRDFIAKASWVAVNDYEAELLVERTGWSLDHIASQVRGVIVTRGEHGCRIWSEGGGATDIPGVPASQVLDPTGCGDAFRAGLLFGLSKGWTLADSTRLGNVLGAEKIAVHGPQNHHITLQGALERLQTVYGSAPQRV
ncbi:MULTISPECIES: carbohydrate kinase family protein [unclassified Thiomonas]|jgi:adenosine kinase|uniref:carbohydrate kinase family protein n=1 Tax=unclassified Thiomonas TaxID=2625466 RepID=UPI0004DBC485|nr:MULTISPECIES: carbohydrate kinase family protein [unclassified Thiomonas]CQR43859.1 putative adenosine kinase [Thiomonas sp. CB3]CDW92667.1 putative adenosine kinase [Thiomonas sp. CB2]VDY05626.1 putative adenosine kinase [Thiomonas sp. Bio17B3]VDY07207.1 putative adenosine kinase [Thiomonas sp. Sup16B3]VDY13882.1 putative adenosine kinase [Thiomonas sp. OC7]